MWWGKSNNPTDEVIKTMLDHGTRLSNLESHREHCDSQHVEHRRRSDDSIKIQNSTDATLKEILNEFRAFRESFMPSIVRARDDQIARDRIKAYALWISAVIGAVSAIVAAIHLAG